MDGHVWYIKVRKAGYSFNNWKCWEKRMSLTDYSRLFLKIQKKMKIKEKARILATRSHKYWKFMYVESSRLLKELQIGKVWRGVEPVPKMSVDKDCVYNNVSMIYWVVEQALLLLAACTKIPRVWKVRKCIRVNNSKCDHYTYQVHPYDHHSNATVVMLKTKKSS